MALEDYDLLVGVLIASPIRMPLDARTSVTVLAWMGMYSRILAISVLSGTCSLLMASVAPLPLRFRVKFMLNVISLLSKYRMSTASLVAMVLGASWLMCFL